MNTDIAISFLFNRLNRNKYESQDFPEIKHLHLFLSHLLKTVKLNFPAMSCSFKTDPAWLLTYL